MTSVTERVRNWLAAVGAILLALLAGLAIGRRKTQRPLAREVDKQVARTEDAARRAGDVIAEERRRQLDRKRRAEALDERLRRLPKAPLIVVLCVALAAVAPVALAAEPPPAPPSSSDLPGDYQTLAKLYLEVVQIAAEYRALYQEAEQSNTRLLAELEALRAELQRLTQVVERQQQLIERQQGAILDLLRGLRVSAGLSLRGGSPPELAPWVALSYEF